MAALEHRLETSPKTVNPSIPDYEELPDDSPTDTPKLFQVQVLPRRTVENEYVPSPEGSPLMDTHRMRAHTVSNPLARLVPGVTEFAAQDPASCCVHDDATGGSLATHKHLSIVSMESGLSFGFDVDKDFNPSLPLESQPWYHGRITRSETESLLHEDGDFLVRENVTMPNTFTLSVYWRGRCDHTLIETTEVLSNRNSGGHGKGIKYHFDGGAFDSVPELVYNHLKYQIPVDQDIQSLLAAPVYRAGLSRVTAYSTDSELSPTQFHTLPKALSGGGGGHKAKPRSTTPEPHRHSAVRPLRTVSVSPNTSPQGSPMRKGEATIRESVSSGDLIDKHGPTHTSRGIISPLPLSEVRSRAATLAVPADARHARQVSGDDYELMGSVSILDVSSQGSLTEHPTPTPTSSSSSLTTGAQQTSYAQEAVKYAELVSFQQQALSRGSLPPSLHPPGQQDKSVKYAEVRFLQSGQAPGAVAGSGQVPPPFCIYDSVAPPIHSPYQSRAEVLAQKMQNETTYAIPKARLREHAQVQRMESSPHPFSQYASVTVKTRRATTPPSTENQPSASLVVPQNPYAEGTCYNSSVGQTESPYAASDRSRPSEHNTLSRQESVQQQQQQQRVSEAPPSSATGKTSLNPIASARVNKDLPGYDSLAQLHGLLSAHTTEELAAHLTQADAVQFMLAPRPGEESKVWKKRWVESFLGVGYKSGSVYAHVGGGY